MRFEIPSDFKKIKEVSNKILRCLNEKQADNSFLFDIKLASEEAMINAIKYGNKSQIDKTIRIDCNINDRSVVIAVEDKGKGFDYRNLPDPTRNENIAKSGGRGLFLIRNIMDKVEFNNRGNRIIMTKFFPKTQREVKRCK